MTCRAKCATQDHESYGACLRSAGVGVNLQVSPRNPIDMNYKAYRAAREEGIQPDGSSMRQIERAKAFSDSTGVAYDGGDKAGTLMKARGLG